MANQIFDAWGDSWGSPSAWSVSWLQRVAAGGGDPDRSRRRKRLRASAIARKRYEEQRRRQIIPPKPRKIAAVSAEEQARVEAEAAFLKARAERDAAERREVLARRLTEGFVETVDAEARAAKLARDEEAILVLLLDAA